MSVFKRFHKETQIFKPDAIGNGIEYASQRADKYITDISDEGIWVCPDGHGPDPTSHQATSGTTGWHISNAIDLVCGGVSYLWAGLSNGIAQMRLGLENASHLTTSSTRIRGTNGAGVDMLDIDMAARNTDSLVVKPIENTPIHWEDGQQESTTETLDILLGSLSPVSQHDITVSCYIEAELPGNVSFSGGYADYGFTPGTAQTWNCDITIMVSPPTPTSPPVTTTYVTGISISYDGDETITITSSSTAPTGTPVESVDMTVLGVSYIATMDVPAFTFGTRLPGAVGSYSSAIGLGLTASGDAQSVIGKYNANSPSNAFEIGNGTSNGNRSNAFAVDWSGNVSCGTDSLAITRNTSNTSSVTTAIAYKAANVVTVHVVALKLSSALADDTAIDVATISDSSFHPKQNVYAPLCLTANMGSSYARITPSGVISVRNERGSSIPTTASIAFTATYVV